MENWNDWDDLSSEQRNREEQEYKLLTSQIALITPVFLCAVQYPWRKVMTSHSLRKWVIAVIDWEWACTVGASTMASGVEKGYQFSLSYSLSPPFISIWCVNQVYWHWLLKDQHWQGRGIEHELLKSSFPAFPTSSGNSCELGLFCIVLSSLAQVLFSSLVGTSLLFYEHGLVSGW